MPPSWVNTGNENVTKGEPKGGVGKPSRPLPHDCTQREKISLWVRFSRRALNHSTAHASGRP